MYMNQKNIIHICGCCKKAKATNSTYDEITGLTSYYCDYCEEQTYWTEKVFWEQYGFEIE